MEDNTRCRAAYEAVREVLFREPVTENELDTLTDAMGILYSRLPEAQ
jgi:hypothetical protein